MADRRALEKPVRPNNYLPLTAYRTDPWQTDAFGAKPDVVPKTERKLQGSGIIASRHGKLS